MKILYCLLILIMLVSGCSRQKADFQTADRDLIVYTGEPFMSKSVWDDFHYFEARYDCRIVIRNFPDIWLALDDLIRTADSTEVDVICGINNALVNEALDSQIFAQYKSDNIKFIDNKFCFDKSNHFTPYAYSLLGLIYDNRYISNPPRNYGELQDNRWDDVLIMPDPEKTAIGRAFLYQSVAQFGKNGFRYLLKGIAKNILIFPESYDDAYSRFLAGEGHLIPGYITLPVFHSLNRNDSQIQAVVLEEGCFQVIEFAGIVASTDKMILAQRFVDYLLADEFQQRICLQKWMFPLNRDTALPLEFSKVKKVSKDNIFSLDIPTAKAEEKTWLKKLNETLGRN